MSLRCRFVGHDWKHLGRKIGTPAIGATNYTYDGGWKYECRRCGAKHADWPPVRPFYKAWWRFWRRLYSCWWMCASSAAHPRRTRPSKSGSVHWYGTAPWSVWIVEVFVCAPLFAFHQAWGGYIATGGLGPYAPSHWAYVVFAWIDEHYTDPRTQMWAFKDLRDGDFDGWVTVPYWWPADVPLPDPAPQMRVRETPPPDMSKPGTYGSGGTEIEVNNPDGRARFGWITDQPKRFGFPLADAMADSPYREPA